MEKNYPNFLQLIVMSQDDSFRNNKSDVTIIKEYKEIEDNIH